MQLGHVALHHDVRQAAGAGKGGDIFLGALRVAFVAKGKSAVEEEFACFRGDLDELLHGEFLQGGAGFADLRQILAHDAGIHLADLGADFAGFVVFDLSLVERLIGAAFAEGGKMGNGHWLVVFLEGCEDYEHRPRWAMEKHAQSAKSFRDIQSASDCGRRASGIISIKALLRLE